MRRSLSQSASKKLFHAGIDAKKPWKATWKTLGSQRGSKILQQILDPIINPHISSWKSMLQVELGFLITCLMGSAHQQLQSPFSTVGIGLQAYHMQQEGSKHWHPFAYDPAAPLQASDLHLIPVSMYIPPQLHVQELILFECHWLMLRYCCNRNWTCTIHIQSGGQCCCDPLLYLVSKMLPQILDKRNMLQKWGKVQGHPI